MLCGRVVRFLPRTVSKAVAASCRSMSGKQSGLTEGEMHAIEGQFLRADKNLDHKLDMWEFNDFTKYSMGRRLHMVDLIELFNVLDSDKDGEVDRNDIYKFLEKRFNVISRTTLEKAFCTYDKDKDGYLKLHEMRQALHFMGYPAGHKKLRDVFYRYDTDHDHHITYHQFSTIVRKEMPQFFGLL